MRSTAGCWATRRPLDIPQHDGPAGAGAGDRRQIDAPLGGQLGARQAMRASPAPGGSGGGGAAAGFAGTGSGRPRCGRSARAASPAARGRASPSTRISASGVPTGTFVPGSTSSRSTDAGLEDLDLDRALLGLDDGDDVALASRVAGLL